MVSECSSIIPELKSYLHFSWCVLNISKLYKGRKVRAAQTVHPREEALGLALEEVWISF